MSTRSVTLPAWCPTWDGQPPAPRTKRFPRAAPPGCRPQPPGRARSRPEDAEDDDTRQGFVNFTRWSARLPGTQRRAAARTDELVTEDRLSEGAVPAARAEPLTAPVPPGPAPNNAPRRPPPSTNSPYARSSTVSPPSSPSSTAPTTASPTSTTP